MSDRIDSVPDTLDHIRRVQQLINEFAFTLVERGRLHDKTKLEDPEKELFDSVGGRLKTLSYGTDEYKKSLDDLGPALDHHYACNSHHPQHYSNGINGMNLYDIVEMYVDWRAATERTKGGDIRKSIEVNKDRFSMDPQLVDIFRNTAG